MIGLVCSLREVYQRDFAQDMESKRPRFAVRRILEDKTREVPHGA